MNLVMFKCTKCHEKYLTKVDDSSHQCPNCNHVDEAEIIVVEGSPLALKKLGDFLKSQKNEN